MRAKFVNESYKDNVSYKEAVEFAEDAVTKMGPRQKILGPAARKTFKGDSYYVETGGVSREYRSEDLDELLIAMQAVEDTMNNVTWSVSSPTDEWGSFRINFHSDEERRTGDAISKYYRDKPSGGFTGD